MTDRIERMIADPEGYRREAQEEARRIMAEHVQWQREVEAAQRRRRHRALIRGLARFFGIGR